MLMDNLGSGNTGYFTTVRLRKAGAFWKFLVTCRKIHFPLRKRPS